MPKLIHTMIRVLDAERSKAFYCGVLGLEEVHRMEMPAFTLIYLREPESGFEIELTVNNDQTEHYSHGSGYGHVAFNVSDLDQLRADFLNRGFAPGEIKTLVATGSSARFFFVADPDGYKVELLEKAGHYA